MIKIGLSLAAATVLLATRAWSADDLRVDQAPPTDVDVVIELGLGGIIRPEYEGSEDYEVFPWPLIGFGYLVIPGLFAIGSPEAQAGGFAVGPSFNYSSDRDFNDDPDLVGLDDVDAAFEAGLRASYEWTNAEIWGEARYAFGGAEGVVGEFGVNAVARPTPELELKLGPFATAASADYLGTYFGVSAQESANTGFRVDAFDPDGGFKSVGIKGVARYEFRPTWFLNAEATYSRLVGDAADSPIVKAGTEDQFSFGLGISKRFSFDLF
ncbi:MipA/OmpV family protein [Arvimicrobium flavum]|uniref:MipA/OmpV family protein n=1 Tax=Arvimicrobium flavum TaxID=3393320 RepID=UPI00237C41BF|nr:MipA/OmpV family protein [Mesorhizobium shangrilense]